MTTFFAYTEIPFEQTILFVSSYEITFLTF